MRRILFVTGSRGEWGYIRPILQLIRESSDLSYELVVTSMHLLPEFGSTIKEIEKDGFTIHHRPNMTLAGYTPATMVKSLGVFTMAMADILDANPPDVILLAGDRGDQLIAAIAGAHLNIPVAHIQAGEVSGNIDGQTRHAITRFSHLHFASNRDAALRLKKMGEQDFRIHQVGAPQLDELRAWKVVPAELMRDQYPIDVEEPFILLVQHPVTEEYRDAANQMAVTMRAVLQVGMPVVVIYPNSDAGHIAMKREIEKSGRPEVHIFRSVPRRSFAGFLAHAAVMVGNSSSGLIESPHFELPAVNVGRRQAGRMQGANVINCDHEEQAIVRAIRKGLDAGFRKSLQGMKNPYGDGKSSGRIVDILRNIPIDENLLKKHLAY